ncbi:MAG: protein tyrosine phosphatase family protein [Acidimicrobiia bacterium]
MGIEDSYNFRRIDERLTTSGVVTAEQLRGLRADGYDAVVNLLPNESEHAVPEEAVLVTAQGVDYVHIPVDFAAPTHADFEAFATAMDAHAEQRVHVHCAANYRVSAFYSLYALEHGLVDVEQADDLVRDLWDADADPVWSGFLAAERARIQGGD